MIFFFTGTGNSRWAAYQLKYSEKDPVFFIPDILKEEREKITYPIQKDEKLIFVFPVHSWGPPAIITQFINKLTLQGYTNQPVYAVCTCGDDCGYTKQMIKESIRKKGWNFGECYSITMPNNYILFPGFDVDTPKVENKKISDAGKIIGKIAEAIHKTIPIACYTQGSFPFIKSRLIHPLFNKYALGKNSFYVKDSCISCGLCEKVCPTDTIYMESGTPHWKDTCIQCVACIHRCPVQAIEYGKITPGKGRYHHPDIK